MAIVQEDDKGLFVTIDNCIARPGHATYAHITDDGGLKKGDQVEAYLLPECSLVRLNISKDKHRTWYIDLDDI
jgi:hypothetical protein